MVEPTHLKNMRTSNWIHLPQFSGWKFQKYLGENTTYRPPTVFHRYTILPFQVAGWFSNQPTLLGGSSQLLSKWLGWGFPPFLGHEVETAIWKGVPQPDSCTGTNPTITMVMETTYSLRGPVHGIRILQPLKAKRHVRRCSAFLSPCLG